MNEYFGFNINASNCTSDDAFNLTACFLDESTKRIKLGGYDIYFTRVINVNKVLNKSFVTTDDFDDKADRLIVIEDSECNEVMRMTMNYVMTQQFKEDLKHQLNVFNI